MCIWHIRRDAGTGTGSRLYAGGPLAQSMQTWCLDRVVSRRERALDDTGSDRSAPEPIRYALFAFDLYTAPPWISGVA